MQRKLFLKEALLVSRRMTGDGGQTHKLTHLLWGTRGKGNSLMRSRFRHVVLAGIDVFVVALALWAALLIRFDGDVPAAYLQALTTAIPLLVVVRITAFYLFGLYRSLWRYAGVREVIAVLGAVISGTVAFYVLNWAFQLFSLPLSVYGIELMATTLGIGGVRLLVRLRRVFNGAGRSERRTRALIVGAGDAGSLLVREFESQPWLGVQIVGLVDDDASKVNRSLHGVRVVGRRSEIPNLVRKYQANQVIIAMPSAPPKVIHETIELCKQAEAQLRILPPINEMIAGKVRAQDVRDVEIEDLLRREPVKTDLEAIAGYIRGRRVLVTGAGGSIGSELCRQVASFGPSELHLLGHGENSIFDIQNELQQKHPELTLTALIADVQDELSIRRLFEKIRPEVVFHAAAHKHVPLMEFNPDAAVRNNVFGTRNVAEAAAATGAEAFVMISTDKAVNPGNVMGATKRLAEMVVQAMATQSTTRFVSVRFGNVLGSRGSVVPFFKKQIAQGGPVTVTHPEMRRYFMTIPEAVQLVLQAGSIGKGGEVFVLDMGEPVKIVDLARDLIRLSGYEPGKDIEIVFTGVRPGEKLFEELVNHGESVRQTEHEKIQALNGELPDMEVIQEILHDMNELILQADLKGLVERLYEVVGARPATAAPISADEADESVAGMHQVAAAQEARNR